MYRYVDIKVESFYVLWLLMWYVDILSLYIIFSSLCNSHYALFNEVLNGLFYMCLFVLLNI